MAAEYIDEGESALVLMGDDFIWNHDGSSEAARLMQAASIDGAAMLGVNVPREYVSRYGVLKLTENGEYQAIVEKPDIENAPSTLINISKYLLPKQVIDACSTVEENPRRGEYEITDAVNQFASSGGRINVVETQGEFLDGGSVEGWLHANNVVVGGLENSI